MSDLARALIIAAALLSGALVVRGTFGSDRYQLVPSGGSAAFRLDRMTGGVVFCTPAFCRSLPMLVPRSAAPPQSPGPEALPPSQKSPEPAAERAT